MPEIFSESIVHLLLAFVVLAILIGASIYVVGLFRADSLQQDQKTEDHLDYFRDLKLRGKLSDEEFRIIKKQLSVKIVEEQKERIGEPASDPIPDLALLLNRGGERMDVYTETGGETRLHGDHGDEEETVAFRERKN